MFRNIYKNLVYKNLIYINNQNNIKHFRSLLEIDNIDCNTLDKNDNENKKNDRENYKSEFEPSLDYNVEKYIDEYDVKTEINPESIDCQHSHK
uniref:Uncharacterized protein n=1 Tax=viral metagenome TaxID=1070528 RepID=A0A6C0JFT1_9ZZZZ